MGKSRILWDDFVGSMNTYKNLLRYCWIGIVYVGACSSPAAYDVDGISSGGKGKKSTVVKAPVPESTTAGNILIAVDETLRPVIQAEVESFEFTYKDAHITPIYLPGEDAIEAMLNSDSIRLVIGSRDLNEEERLYLKDQNTSAKVSCLARDAIALMVHPENPDSLLELEQVKGILTGQIQSWKEINPESPLDEILLMFDDPQSSTVQFLRDSLLEGAALYEQAATAKGNIEVMSEVAKRRNAIGVMGWGWISDPESEIRKEYRGMVKPVSLAPLQDTCSYKGEFFPPLQGFVHQECYPLRRSVMAVLREPRVGLGTGFVSYIDSDPGQRIIHKSGLITVRGITRRVIFPKILKDTTKNTSKKIKTEVEIRIDTQAYINFT